jgi:SAM-dependent methyltransferase
MPTCPICSNSNTVLWSAARDYEYFSTGKTYEYFQCTDCGTLFIDPLPTDELAIIYPSNYYSFVTTKKNAVWRIKEWLDKRKLRSVLQGLKADEISVLDVGGGTGWLSTLVRQTDPRVKFTQIVDIDQAAKYKAEQEGHDYFQGRLEDFTTDKKFDLILLLNLIEHVAEPVSVLKKAGSLLRPGGVILIKTPNTQSLDARIFHRSYWGGLHCPRHWVIFSEKSFRKAAALSGLFVKSLDYTQGGPFWAFSIIIAFYRKGWLKVSRERPVIFHPLFPLVSACGAAFDFFRRPFAKTSQLFILLTRPEEKIP